MVDRPLLAADPDPQGTERRILELLAELGPYETLHRRRMSQQVWGTDLAHASRTYSALGRLHNRRLVARGAAPHSTWKITDAGRAALALDRTLTEGEPA